MKLKNKLEVEETLEVGVIPNASPSNFSVVFETAGLFQRRQVGSIINKNDNEYLPSVSNAFPTSVFVVNASTTHANPNLTVSFVNQVAGTVFAAPQSLNGTPAFRMLQDSDLSQTSLSSKQNQLTDGLHTIINVDKIDVELDVNEWLYDSDGNPRILASVVPSGTNHDDFVLRQASSDGFFKLRNAQDDDFFVYRNSTEEVMFPLVGVSTGTTTNIVTMGSDGAMWRSNRTIGDFALASQIPTNYITTNTNQTGLSGNKTTSGDWTFSSANANPLALIRNNQASNITLGYGTQNGMFMYAGLANENIYAIGSASGLNNVSNRWMWVDNTGKVTATNGFSKTGATDTDMLLGAGGHRPVSDFALASSIPTVNDGQLSLSTGTGLSGSASFSANQAGNSTFNVEIASGYVLPTTAQVNSWNAKGNGTVTSITAGTGLSGGTITTSGTIALNSATLASLALANTAVQPSALAGYVLKSGDTMSGELAFSDSNGINITKNITSTGGWNRVLGEFKHSSTALGGLSMFGNGTNLNYIHLGIGGTGNHIDTMYKFGNAGLAIGLSGTTSPTEALYVNGSVRFASLNSAGFVKTDSNGTLSVDTNTYALASSVPSQVNLTQGTGIGITGTYPNLTITNTDPNIIQTLSQSGQVVTLSNGGGSVTIPFTDWTDIPNKPSLFPPSSHTHPINQVTGLQNALDDKADTDGGNATGGLATTIANSHTHSNKAVLDGITAGDITNWDNKFTLPSGGNAGQYVNGLGNLATIPTVNDGTFQVQGTGSLTGSGSTSANASANTGANLDLTQAEKDRIQEGVDANAEIPALIEGVGFHHVASTADYTVTITNKKTIVNVAYGVLEAELYIEDAPYVGYELAINGCNEWSAYLNGNIQNKCSDVGRFYNGANSVLFWWDGDMWVQAI